VTGWLRIMSEGTTYTPKELFMSMSDPQKLEFIAGLIATMSPEFKDTVIAELGGALKDGDLDLRISSNEHAVRIDFARLVKWIALPKEHAIQLAMLLIEHSGAHLERVEKTNPTKIDG